MNEHLMNIFPNKIVVQLKILDPSLFLDADQTPESDPTRFPLPRYATPGSAAFDLIAAESVLIKPGQVIAIKTGISIHIADPTYVACVFARSGQGSRGLVLANGTGIVDSDYQGELITNMWNRCPEGGQSFSIKRGERFAQVVILPVVQAQLYVVSEFTASSQRGAGGFGSTGA